MANERIPGIEIPLEDMNNELKLSAPLEINTSKLGDNLLLVLVNSSENLIELDPKITECTFTSMSMKRGNRSKIGWSYPPW